MFMIQFFNGNLMMSRLSSIMQSFFSIVEKRNLLNNMFFGLSVLLPIRKKILREEYEYRSKTISILYIA